MSTQIIALEEVHFEQWLPLWQGYLRFYNAQMGDEQIRLSWKRITNPDQTVMFGFAIKVNGQVVGFVHLISHPSMWTNLPYCYLQDLFIDEKFRNQGLAQQLIKHCYQVCTGKFDRIYWLTQASNITAQYLYDRIATKTGFIQYKKALA
ncbi:GNAT family N-acetyltransferase [Acinetobacter bereziniae]|uniref:GNAT family N-acetyltransferase n=1 Tax=Acinetobacter bereziniae TaxID=106648 RepID=UPI001901DFFF|nr:GNAT family N-acetyltransferase [Acinetobacter bereziniae]MBJ8450212.1 GNAT family N-acetyltransferase [Acinetobacter bereziniae]MBJ8454753.1 GNAT family N-acetyltransferase [Acinetobacter bereziniae]